MNRREKYPKKLNQSELNEKRQWKPHENVEQNVIHRYDDLHLKYRFDRIVHSWIDKLARFGTRLIGFYWNQHNTESRRFPFALISATNKFQFKQRIKGTFVKRRCTRWINSSRVSCTTPSKRMMEWSKVSPFEWDECQWMNFERKFRECDYEHRHLQYIVTLHKLHSKCNNEFSVCMFCCVFSFI